MVAWIVLIFLVMSEKKSSSCAVGGELQMKGHPGKFAAIWKASATVLHEGDTQLQSPSHTTSFFQHVWYLVLGISFVEGFSNVF